MSDTAAVEARGNWTLRSFPTGGLPFFERPEEFFAAYEAFLRRVSIGNL